MFGRISIFLLIFTSTNAQLSCNNFWKYTQERDIQGIITFKPPIVSEHKLKVQLSVGARISSNYVGDISLVKNRQETINDIKKGLSINYRVRFPIQVPLPKIEAIFYNGQKLCTGTKDVGNIITTINLEHTLLVEKNQQQQFETNPYDQQQQQQKPNNQFNNENDIDTVLNQFTTTQPYNYFNGAQNSLNQQSNYNFQNSQPSSFNHQFPKNLHFNPQSQTFNPHNPSNGNPFAQNSNYNPQSLNNNHQVTNLIKTQEKTFSSQNYDQFTRPSPNNYEGGSRTGEFSIPFQSNSQQFQCGVRKESQYVTSLIIGGATATRTDFPWLAALFHRYKSFVCGGSLVSKKIIITAAHCVLDKNSKQPIRAYDSTFYIGKYKLIDLYESGYISSGVDEFILHPQWNSREKSYRNDICIAILTRGVEFAINISPICIWPQMNSHSDLIGKRGLIAGFGITDKGYISNYPQFTSLPVVDDATCLRSNNYLYEITSETNFCVGDRTGRAPCQGDSGGAFAVKVGDKYYLRGIVSAALLNLEGQCSRTDYVVFTDVSLYSNWINSYINVYG